MISSLVFLSLAPCLAAENVSAVDRALGVIAQKAAMKNCYSLRLRIESRTPNAPAPIETAWASTLHIWRDGNKFRVDHLDAQYTPVRREYELGSRHVLCENCEEEGYGIVTVVKPGSPSSLLHKVEFHRLGTHNFDYYCTHFDWRYFGLSNDFRCLYPRLHIATDFPKFFGAADVTTKTENRADAPCLVAFRKSAALDQSVWLSERDGFNPVYFESKFVVGDAPETRTTEIRWQRTAGGHVYPRTVKHNTMVSIKGVKYPTEEVVTVTHADFDSPIDPKIFTLAGFALNENQAIGLPGLEPLDFPLWRDGKVDRSYTLKKRIEETTKKQPNNGQPDKGQSDDQRPEAHYPTQANTSLVMGIVAAVISVATALCAIIIHRRRAAT